MRLAISYVSQERKHAIYFQNSDLYPIIEVMKPVTTFRIYIMIFLSTSVFSCTRAVDNEKTSITITFPNSQSVKNLKTFSQNLTAFNILDDGITSIASSEGDFAPEPAIPTDEYKYSCYLLAVSYPEPAANRNFCGVKQLTAGVRVSSAPVSPAIADEVSITPTFFFSQNFKGLFDPNRSSTVELQDVTVGKDRSFVVVAVPTNDPNTCVDLLNQPMQKGSMLRPRIIGKVTQDVQVSGNEVKIGIDEANPLDRFDDCIVTDTKLNYPNAEKMVIEQENFPFNYMREDSN